jgi:glycine cleavage system H protein
MNIPGDLKYTKDHEWVLAAGDTATVGITEFAQSELGDLVFVDLPVIGKRLTAGANLCVVESTKAASDVYAPIAGEVVARNEALLKDPGLVNREPYAGGWIVKIKFDGNLSQLMDSATYSDIISKKK